MAKQIITPNQKKFLELFAESNLVNSFFFSGGTALSYYYLQHRFSEDLDFFSLKEIDLQAITVFISSIKNEISYTHFDFQQSFNRNIYQLRFADATFLKTEFTYYPFNHIEKPTFKEGIYIDSLTDIAANKLFTIAQQPRGRDYFDLYSINKKEPISSDQLRIQAKAKFDWHIDPLQLGSQFDRVDTFLDDPILVSSTNQEDVVMYFKQLAKSMRGEILE